MTIEHSIKFKDFADKNFPAEGQLASLGSLSQYERLYEFVKSIPVGSAILDWGCGNGHFSAYLKYKGYQPKSFSFNEPTFIDKSGHILGNPLEPRVIPFADNTFDYVFSVGVLEHVHETGGSQEESLKEIHRILKPGGMFVVYHFPNRYSWIEFAANLLAKVKLHSHYTHTRKFDTRDISELFKSWEIISATRYGLLPRNIFGRIPKSLSSQAVIKCYDFIDRFMAKVFNPLTQNHIIVARKNNIS